MKTFFMVIFCNSVLKDVKGFKGNPLPNIMNENSKLRTRR